MFPNGAPMEREAPSLEPVVFFGIHTYQSPPS